MNFFSSLLFWAYANRVRHVYIKLALLLLALEVAFVFGICSKIVFSICSKTPQLLSQPTFQAMTRVVFLWVEHLALWIYDLRWRREQHGASFSIGLFDLTLFFVRLELSISLLVNLVENLIMLFQSSDCTPNIEWEAITFAFAHEIVQHVQELAYVFTICFLIALIIKKLEEEVFDEQIAALSSSEQAEKRRPWILSWQTYLWKKTIKHYNYHYHYT